MMMDFYELTMANGYFKDHDKDVSEAIDTLQRHLEMNQEERDCHAG